MALKLGKSILAAASTGLMLGAVAACGGSAPPVEAPASPEAPAAAAPAAPEAPAAAAPTDATAMPVAAEGKACCKTMNECKGKGGCKTDTNSCAGKNECKGKGGCKARANCPK
jgi:hypothetical protein